MPTRITLNRNARRNEQRALESPEIDLPFVPSTFRVPGLSSHHRRRIPSVEDARESYRRRSVVSLRSSVLRELSVRSGDDDGDSDEIRESRLVRASPNDITASPRLMGYMFALTAAAVMLVSVIQ